MSRCETCIHNKVCVEVDSLHCRSDFVWYKAESGCPYYSTADVAPRAEVAREIINYIAPQCKFVTSDNIEFDIGYVTAMNKVLAMLVELKKKYTEGGSGNET